MTPARDTLRRALATKRAPKYGNHRIETPHGTFDSRGEYERWLVLGQLARTGALTDLERQVRYTLLEPREVRIEMVLDYRYRDQRLGGALTVEDFKSPVTETREFKLKLKLFRWLHPDVRVVISGRDAPRVLAPLGGGA